MIRQFSSSLDAEGLRGLKQRCRRAHFGAGAFVFHSGEAGEHVHLIQSGRVAVLAVTPQGEALTLTILGVGDMFGELALLSERHERTATVQALVTTETLVLSRADFEAARRSNPEVNEFLIGLLTSQVTRLTQRIVEMNSLTAPERVYRRLVELGATFEVVGTLEGIPITQEQLASMASTSQRATNGALTKAKREGVLDLARRSIVIQNWPELRRRARLKPLVAQT